jgi:hypothetical protein
MTALLSRLRRALLEIADPSRARVPLDGHDPDVRADAWVLRAHEAARDFINDDCP